MGRGGLVFRDWSRRRDIWRRGVRHAPPAAGVSGWHGTSPGTIAEGDMGMGWHDLAVQSARRHRPARPSTRSRTDEARGRMVSLRGGSSNRSCGGSSWEYDGTTWTRVATDGPPGRAHFGMAYDATSQRVIIFGGLTRTTCKELSGCERHWAADGKSGSNSVLRADPGAHIRMAFDRRTNKMVVSAARRMVPRHRWGTHGR